MAKNNRNRNFDSDFDREGRDITATDDDLGIMGQDMIETGAGQDIAGDNLSATATKAKQKLQQDQQTTLQTKRANQSDR